MLLVVHAMALQNISVCVILTRYLNEPFWKLYVSGTYTANEVPPVRPLNMKTIPPLRPPIIFGSKTSHSILYGSRFKDLLAIRPLLSVARVGALAIC